MTTAILTKPGAGDAYAAAVPQQMGPILVTTDGTTTADGAFWAASLVADPTDASVHVLSVLEPQSLVLPSPEALATPIDLSQSFAARRYTTVLRQVERVVGVGTKWPTEVRIGQPAAVIAAAAGEYGAGLIVTGLNHHNPLERLVGGDTPLQIAKLADMPLLAVPPEFTAFPRTVVVAVDLTASSIRAAEAARPLLRDATTLYLVHVKPRIDLPVEIWTGLDHEYEEAKREAFASATAALELPPDLLAQPTTLTGTPAREIVRFAQAKGADLIIAGHSRRSFLDRMLGGSVAARLYRATPCAVLIVPDAMAKSAARPRFLGYTESVRDPAQWPALFREFTYRNTARRATLEIDEGELGAQAEARDYPFLGVDYDPRDGTVEVMLGDFPPGPRHLTHVVAKPIAVDVLRDPDGKDRVLHIARDGGQTLVTLS
jgi:nucleotide-binding universal stress UspA family protein